MEKCCYRAGADLREECSVKDAVLDKTSGMWTVTLDDNTTFRARVITCTLALYLRNGAR